MAEALQSELINYLSTIAGDRPWLEPVKQDQTAKLPLFLRDKYQLYRADLFGRKLFLAIENRRQEEPSPTDYAKDAAGLSRILAGDVVPVIAELPSYIRNRMVHQHVPFIVPGTQMFLPMLMIDLREHYPRRRGHAQHLLSSVAQVLVIYHLVRAPLNEISLKDIAIRLRYSATAIGKANDELRDAGLCEVERAGKALTLLFRGNKAELWRNAEPFMSTPVRRTYWVLWGSRRPQAVTAGTTALSQQTMLADDRVPTFALRDKVVSTAFEQGQLIGCPDRERAEARIEAWRYDPFLLSLDEKSADPCSIYLSLRRSADERVQKALADLLDGCLR